MMEDVKIAAKASTHSRHARAFLQGMTFAAATTPFKYSFKTKTAKGVSLVNLIHEFDLLNQTVSLNLPPLPRKPEHYGYVATNFPRCLGTTERVMQPPQCANTRTYRQNRTRLS